MHDGMPAGRGVQRSPNGAGGVCVVVRLGPPALRTWLRGIVWYLPGVFDVRAGLLCWWVLCDLARGLLLRWCLVLGLTVVPVDGHLG